MNQTAFLLKLFLKVGKLEKNMFREEEEGILSAFPKFKDTVITTILSMAEPRMGIINLANSYGKREIPYSIVAAFILVLALFGIVTTQPQILEGFGLFFSVRNNQIFSIIAGVLITLILYLIIKRKKRVVR